MPGLKIHLESLIKKIRNVLKNYQRNEKNLEMNKEYENIYLEKLKKYNEFTSNEILNVDIFNEISKKVDSNVFYDLLLEDYYTIFISKNLYRIKRKFNKEKNDDKNLFNLNLLKNVLKLLVSLRRYEGNEMEPNKGIECLANAINWTESYSEEINIILEIFSKLNTKIDNLFNKIEENIKRINKNVNSKTNKAILYMIESILKIVLSNSQIYIDKINDRNEFFQLLNAYKDILCQILQININLRLHSKEIIYLQVLMEIIDFLFLTKKDQLENIIKVIQFLSKESTLTNEEKEKDKVKILIDLFNFLNELVGDNENFPKLIAFILKNEYHLISNKLAKLKLLKYILENKYIIYHCFQLIKKEISIENTPEGMKNNLKNLQKIDIYKELICNYNNEFLDEIIINSYEYEINKFFGQISNLKFDDKNKIFFRTF